MTEPKEIWIYQDGHDWDGYERMRVAFENSDWAKAQPKAMRVIEYSAYENLNECLNLALECLKQLEAIEIQYGYTAGPALGQKNRHILGSIKPSETIAAIEAIEAKLKGGDE